jgi:hypothetical protein
MSPVPLVLMTGPLHMVPVMLAFAWYSWIMVPPVGWYALLA